ncbi:HAD family hydrolase [Candidatus Micrarchaeota archaeon]|nr:HAD family hydrolase [Candidatus Micrarchaeota archaeon]
MARALRRSIILDFDGTIVDYRERFYQAYCNFAKKPLDCKTFWGLRAQNKKMAELLDSPHFLKDFDMALESPDLLQEDKLLCPPEFLHALKKKYNLVVITNRKNEKALLLQINTLGIQDCFSEIMTTADLDKQAIISQYSKKDVVVGDSEEEIIAGNKSGLITIGVLSGLRTREQLLKANPRVIIESIMELPKVLEGLDFLV